MNMLQKLQEIKDLQDSLEVLHEELDTLFLSRLNTSTKLLTCFHILDGKISFSVWEYSLGVRDSARFNLQKGIWVVEARGTFDDGQVESIRLVLEELMLEGKDAN